MMKHSFLMKTTLAAMCAAYSLSAWADARIRTETYDKERIYTIYSQVGKAALIQLEDDEQLKGDATALGMGDSEAWAMGVRGNNILFKPKAEKPVTNMIVVSNKRTYAFDLKMASSQHQLTYILRFHYPDTAKKRQAAAYAKQDRAFQVLRDAGNDPNMPKNTDYFGKGNKNLAPTAIYDNGRFTFLKFDNGRDMPAIYRVEQDGSETLLNAHIEDDTVVIHEVNQKIMLRLGQAVLLIENRGYQPTGTFNRTGTDDNETVRLTK